MKPRPVRVVLADPSRGRPPALEASLCATGRVEVVGRAATLEGVLDEIARARPDVLVTEILDDEAAGLGALSAIMGEAPVPILVLTADPRGRSPDWVFEALRAGALEVLSRPAGGALSVAAAAQLCDHLASLARPGEAVAGEPEAASPVPDAPPPIVPAPAGTVRALGLVASAGGPPALARLLAGLPEHFPLPVLVVQHLATGFAAPLAGWLGDASRLPVSVARDGEAMRPSRVLLAPEDRHLLARADGTVALDDGPKVAGHRPSGDRLLASLAEVFGAAAAGVVLTGIGTDGAHGLLAIRRAGGRTLAQDESTSAVYGMPRQALASGAAEAALPLAELPAALAALAGTNP